MTNSNFPCQKLSSLQLSLLGNRPEEDFVQISTFLYQDLNFVLTEFWSLHTVVLWTPRSVILVSYLTSCSLPLTIYTNSMVPLFDQKLINIPPEQNGSTPPLTLHVNSKTQSRSHVHLEIFFSYWALVKQLACNGQAVDTLYMYSQVVTFDGVDSQQFHSWGLQIQTSRQVDEPGLKHHFGNRILAETK